MARDTMALLNKKKLEKERVMTQPRRNTWSLTEWAPPLLLGLTACAWTTQVSANETLTQDVGVTVQSVSQMAITGLGVPVFIVSNADTAGGAPGIVRDPYNRYLQYTSIAPTGESRSLQVQLSAAPPTGMALRLSTNATNGTGAVGVAQYTGSGQAAALLSTTPVDLVTGIGTGYTGDGATDGLLLSYELAMTEDMDQVGTGTQMMEVTFTLASTL